jgi:hypothetical protein
MQDQSVARAFPTTRGRPLAIGNAKLCSQCTSRPSFGALSRCEICVKTAAEVDRQSRVAAETRVGARNRAREAAEPRAAAEHQAALERLGQMYMEFAASPEGVRFLEAQQAELTAPRNHDHVKAALARDKEREVAANETTTVHHWVEWGRNYFVSDVPERSGPRQGARGFGNPPATARSRAALPPRSARQDQVR